MQSSSLNYLILAGSVAVLLLAIALETESCGGGGKGGKGGWGGGKMKYGKPEKMKFGKPEKMKYGKPEKFGKKMKCAKVKSVRPMVASGQHYEGHHDVGRESRMVSVAKILADGMKSVKHSHGARHVDSSGHQNVHGAYGHRQDAYELKRVGQQGPPVGYPVQHTQQAYHQQPPMMNNNYYPNNNQYGFGASNAAAASNAHNYPYNQQMQPLGVAPNYQHTGYGQY